MVTKIFFISQKMLESMNCCLKHMYALKVTDNDYIIIINFTGHSLCMFSFFTMANDQASFSFMQFILFAKAMRSIVTS